MPMGAGDGLRGSQAPVLTYGQGMGGREAFRNELFAVA
eukprot:SAG31_NODE_17442_length_670_cov_1.155867_1_plen_37_part_10